MTTDAVGGVWTYALELCEALAAHDIDVVLASMGPLPSGAQQRDASRLANLHLKTSQYKLEWMQEPWLDVERAGEWLLQLAADEHVDLVHLNGYVHAACAWEKPVVVVAHSCVYSWWHAVHGSRPPQAWEHYREMVEKGLNHASTIVAPTNAFLACLHRSYTFAAPQRVIPNARNAAELRSRSLKEPFILASGRLWDEAKNLKVLDAAASGLAWPILAAGNTLSPDGTPIAAKRLQCLGTQTQSQLASLLRRAAIFAHPALYEPFGLSVLEAAHARCALVLADIATLRELWSDAALFVDPCDASAIRDALQTLIADGARRRRMGERACERAATFRIEPMGDDYRALYETLRHSRVQERSVA
jgi:glycosyltransferase involved in cell wall biosynthesis